MKIFNWVQRKLHQNVIKDGTATNAKSTKSIEIENNTQGLLEQVAVVDVLESWRDGFLTIGTFGFDLLKSSDEQKRKLFPDQEENREDDDDKEVVMESEEPLMLTKFEHSLERILESEDANLIMTVDCADELVPAVGSTELDHGKKRRTTLAELFLADSETHFKNPSFFESELMNHGKNRVYPMKNHISLANKIIPRIKDHEPRPIKKLRQIMKKMLKRKIHPDLDENYKSDGQNTPIKKREAAESVSLLHIPDCII